MCWARAYKSKKTASTDATMHICFFDIDGTLLYSGGAGKAALEAALDEFGVRPTAGQLKLSGRTDRAILVDLLEMHGIADTCENRDRLTHAYLQRLPDCMARASGKVLP